MKESYDLERFVEAQEGVYEEVIAELKRGSKTGHWMWYIFPQIKGLGISEISERYSISSIDEATAYVEHPILGGRLKECTQLVMEVDGKLAQEIFGYPDYLKFRSCMTLFSQATQDNQLFEDALTKYFEDKHDPKTLDILR
jgi:uncharacterized protein (DUF1810 family)